MSRSTLVWFIVIAVLNLCMFSACTTPSKESTDPLTPTEQLLFSSAIKKGLKDFDVGFLKGTSITLTASDLRVDQGLPVTKPQMRDGGRFLFWYFRVFRGYTPVYWSLFEMYPFRIPLLCKERLGEVESCTIGNPRWDQPLSAEKRLPPIALAWCVPQGATFSYKGGGLKDNQLHFLPMRMAEEPLIF